MRMSRYMNIHTLKTNTIQVYKYTLKPHAGFATAETNAYTHILDTKIPDTMIQTHKYPKTQLYTYTQIQNCERACIRIYTYTNIQIHNYRN